jgi:predicted DNA-binding protein with PD1-like motif
MLGTSDLLEGIGTGRVERIVIGKLAMNADLLAGIRELIEREGVRTGWIMSAVGALKKATFRNVKTMPADLKVRREHRVYLELDQPMEIVSLTGWIATKKNGETEVHAHFSASTVLEDKIITLGGHLTPGTITSIKVVVAIAVIQDTNIEAATDPRIDQTDLKLSDRTARVEGSNEN